MSLMDSVFSSPFSRRTFADRTLRCRECGKEFVYRAADQEEAAGRGHYHDPSRCADCRAVRRQRRGDAAQAPAHDAAAGGPGGGRQRREMHSAICAECGAQAQVPFVPRNDRPVYCSNCFEKVRVAR